MWLIIWKDGNGKIRTNAFDHKCDCEQFADDFDQFPGCKILYILYDATA